MADVEHFCVANGLQPDKLKLDSIITEEHIISVATLITEWRLVAESLRLTEAQIEEVEHLEDQGALYKKTKMLRKWRESHYLNATYRRLISALLLINKQEKASDVCHLLGLRPSERANDQPLARNDHGGNPAENSPLLQNRQLPTSFKIKSCTKRSIFFITLYIIFGTLIVFSTPPFKYMYIRLFFNATDYNQDINCGDTILLPVHLHDLIQSIKVSSPACQGKLYLVPVDEVAPRRAQSGPVKLEYFYLVCNSVIHFSKPATNYSFQVWVTNSHTTAGSIASNEKDYLLRCTSPPGGTVCHQFSTGEDGWDCVINETAYYWIEVVPSASLKRGDIKQNLTLYYYYNQTDYANHTYYTFDGVHQSVVDVPFNPPFLAVQKRALLFSADDQCQSTVITLGNINLRYEFIAVPIFFFLISLVTFVMHMCTVCFSKCTRLKMCCS